MYRRQCRAAGAGWAGCRYAWNH